MARSDRGGTPTELKSEEVYSQGNLENSVSALQLYNILRAPCLSLLKLYLASISGTKLVQTALVDFRKSHPKALKTMYVTDQLFDIFLIGLIIFVFMRGLGILK